jgi:hypothetical protein
VAKAIWFGAGVASLVVLLRIGPRALPEMRRSTRWLVVVALVALGKYYARDLLLGQVNVIFTLVATGAIVAICAGREALGGALVALAVVFKPYALIPAALDCRAAAAFRDRGRDRRPCGGARRTSGALWRQRRHRSLQRSGGQR